MNTKERFTEKLNIKLTETQSNIIREYASNHNMGVCETIRYMLFDTTDAKFKLQLNYIINVIKLSKINPQTKEKIIKEICRNETSNY